MFRRYIAPLLPLWAVRFFNPEFIDSLVALENTETNNARLNQLIKLAGTYPEYRAHLLTWLFKQPDTLKCIVTTNKSLNSFIQVFHGCDRFISRLVRKHLKQAFSLAFPGRRLPSLTWMLSRPRPSDFDCSVDTRELQKTAKALPEHHADLLIWLFSHPDRLKQVARYRQKLIELVNAFPSHQTQLLDLLFDEQHSYRSELLTVVTSDDQGISINGLSFSDGFLLNVIRIAEAFPSHKEQLANWLFFDKKYFLKWDYLSVQSLAKAFPNHHAQLLDGLFDEQHSFRLIKFSLLKKTITTLTQVFPHLADWLFTHPDKLEHLVSNISDLERLVEASPNHHTHYLLDWLFAHPDRLKRLIRNIYCLERLAKAFPGHQTQLLAGLFSNPDTLERLVPDIYCLSTLTEAFPRHQTLWLDWLLFANPDILKRLVRGTHDLSSLKIAFPNHYPDLLDKAFSNPDILEWLVSDSSDLILIARRFPKHQTQLLDWLFANPCALKRLVSDSSDLILIARTFPKHQTQLLDWLFANPDTLEGVVIKSLINSTKFLALARWFPELRAHLRNCLLDKHPEIFNLVVTNAQTIRELLVIFPECAHIFGQPSVEAARKAYHQCLSRWEQKAAARLLEQAARTGTGAFKGILRDLHPTIVSFLGCTGAYTTESKEETTALQEATALQAVKTERSRKPTLGR